jgi:hypothetical protein
MSMTVGDALLLLTSIEHHARIARETLAESTILQNQADPIALAGQPPRTPNKTRAAQLMNTHQQSRAQLGAVAAAMFGQKQEAADHGPGDNGVAGKINRLE